MVVSVSETLNPISNIVTEPSARINAQELVVFSRGQSVPGFLLAANEALRAGRKDDALDLLREQDVEALLVCERTGSPRIDLLYMLAKLLLALGQTPQALKVSQQIVTCEPSAVAFFHRALAYRQNEQLAEAITWLERAIQADPEQSLYQHIRANYCLDDECVDEAFRRLETLHERGMLDTAMYEDSLGGSFSVPGIKRIQLHEGYRRLGAMMAQGVQPVAGPVLNADPERRLRVGFMSPDFRRCSTAVPFEVFLKGRDRQDLEIWAYSNVCESDWVTQRIAGNVDRFIPVHGESVAQLAQRIAQDRIDILVAFGGYVRDHLLRVFPYRPAPVQVEYGWVCTTGLTDVDYRLTDAVVDPPDTRSLFSETLVYLDGGAYFFIPPLDCPLICPLPAISRGYVTFGSFNRTDKMSRGVVDCWGRILQAVPNSRLLLKSPAGEEDLLRKRCLELLVRMGIDPQRIEIHGSSPYFDYLSLFNQVDIALDTWPWNGATTTIEALWMGVPILTLTGELMTDRTGLSILSRVGLEAFSTTDSDTYVAKAVAFAGQWGALNTIRRGLRDRLLNSPVCNPRRVGDELGKAFRLMWRRWCAQ
ncbi:tetratricopeptide repeat protein, partial [Planctomycetota bacterium]